MGSRFTWLDSVNSTMDEVKDLIVNQQVCFYHYTHAQLYRTKASCFYRVLCPVPGISSEWHVPAT